MPGGALDDLRARLSSLLLAGVDGRLPCFGDSERPARPGWREPLFFECSPAAGASD